MASCWIQFTESVLAVDLRGKVTTLALRFASLTLLPMSLGRLPGPAEGVSASGGACECPLTSQEVTHG